mgnify:CR=1 FL=1
MTLLSGTFYSIDRLAPVFQTISHANPFFYAISGFRYGFLAEADSPILIGAAVGFEESTQWHVCEFKTSNAKKFAELKKKGAEINKQVFEDPRMALAGDTLTLWTLSGLWQIDLRQPAGKQVFERLVFMTRAKGS